MKSARVTSLLFVAIFGLTCAWLVFKPARWRIARSYWDTVPIVFHGKVTDQAGLPLEGATVGVTISTFDTSYLWRASSTPLKSIYRELTTDADGRFVLRNIDGKAIHITRISKPGFVSAPEKTWLREEGLRRTLVYYYSPSYGPPLVYTPSQDRPATFPLRRRDEIATVLPTRGGANETPLREGQRKMPDKKGSDASTRPILGGV